MLSALSGLRGLGSIKTHPPSLNPKPYRSNEPNSLATNAMCVLQGLKNLRGLDKDNQGHIRFGDYRVIGESNG